MKKVIVDTSVIVKWLNQEDEKGVDKAEEILADSQSGEIELLVPELAKYEVGNVLLIRKKLTLFQIEETLSFLYALPIQFITHSLELAKSTYEIAQAAQITYYDASFVALAKREKALLVTDNPKHQSRQVDIDVKVIPLKDY